jgi:hypothetical protein
LGVVELDCTALVLPDADQRLIVFSAAPGSPANDSPALPRIVGLQHMTETDQSAALQS